MIRIEEIKIEEFRGIRNLTLSLAGKNFAICGPNGTGKSGVVDAIEFGLTGSISRLAGRGTGDISVKEHAPHVDSRDRPDKARVVITASIPSLKKQVTIERSVKDPNNPKITPDDPDILEFLHQVAIHPEFVLSRRELIRYILSTPGDRSREVQTLLRLDQVESLRTVLQRIANKYKRNIAPLQTEQEQAREQLTRVLEIPQLTKEGVLEAVNRRRTILKLPAITALRLTTSVKEGLATITTKLQQARVPKRQIVSDIKKLNTTLQLAGSIETSASCKELSEELSDFASDPVTLQGVTREHFLRTALTLLDDKACPVCDTPWDIDKLQAIIEAKLKRFDVISRRRIELERKIKPMASLVRSIQESVRVVREYNVLPADSAETKILGKFESSCEVTRKALESFLPIPDTIKALKILQTIPSEVLD
ncbi:MAG TPA: chromosome segregation protein SMC, partial [candidate division CPR3 bacterium]|nr:chromosome segregation protein SMC [candidate division CPR3 bacterium]